MPCAQQLWDVNNETKLLDIVNYYLLCLLTDKLLYITRSTGSNIEPDVTFLTKMVAKINVDDGKNLRI